MAGIVLGAIGSGALAWYMPAVDLYRARSIISVQPNGGNAEIFHINLPRDRIMVGISGDENSIPAELEWPGAETLGGLQAEAFKVRDENDEVVGVASRMASSTEASGAFIEWVVHLPARGTFYVEMGVTPMADGMRQGPFRAGTREFAVLQGTMREQFVSDVNQDFDIQGRIELHTALVGPLEDEE